MLPRAAFAIFLAAVCRVSAQEACTDALPAPPAAIAQPQPAVKRVARSAPNDVAQFENRKRRPSWVEALTLLPGELTEGGTRVEKRFSHSGDATQSGL